MTQASSLWGTNHKGSPIQIGSLGFFGETHVGKTTAAMGVCASYEGPKRTLFFDGEKSVADTMETLEDLGIEYFDVHQKMAETKKTYSDLDVFEFFHETISGLEANSCGVIAADTASDFESGLIEWVLNNYKKYGFSTKAKFQAMGGVFWGKVKSEMKQFLTLIQTKCECFVYTNHMKTVYKNNRATSQKEGKGLSPLGQTSTLSIVLERPKKDGVRVDKPRCALKIKDRLSYRWYDKEKGDLQTVRYLPDAFDDCTPAKLRHYFKNPVGLREAEDHERVEERTLTDDERLQMKLEIAEAERDAANANAERDERKAELASQQTTIPNKTENSNLTDGERLEKIENGADMAGQLIELAQEAGFTTEQFQAGVKKRCGTISPLDLTQAQYEEIKSAFQARIAG